MQNESTNQTLDCWAYVELMGHARTAGKVSEQQVAGAGFVRVDVPASDDGPAYTRLFAPSAIYAITPCTEEMAKAAAAQYDHRPLQYLQPRPTGPQQPALTCGDDEDHEDDDEVCF